MRQLLTIIGLTLVTALAGVGFAQDTDTKWLVGVWEGESRPGAGFQPSQMRVEFKDDKGEVRFETLLTSIYPLVHGSRARGSATVSGDAVTMRGEYFAGRLMGGVSYSLTRKGDVLEGTGWGATNVPFKVFLSKVK